MNAPHVPVMLNEVIQALSPEDGKVYVDGTFGAGGYSRAILKAAHCKLYGLDQDPNAAKFAEKLSMEFPGRFAFILGNFSSMCELLAREGVEAVDGIVLDLGVSSMQLDQPERGFSFRHDGPLDMRMSGQGLSAAEVVNSASEKDLADIFYQFGEERASRRIAHAIVEARSEKPIERTSELADIVRSVVRQTSEKDPATRTFQGLRIYINDELGALTRGLLEAEKLLAPGGKLVVVTFHSLEDRLVKRFTHSRCGKLSGASRHLPEGTSPDGVDAPRTFLLEGKGKIVVSDAEAAENPRARSATLRCAVRTDVPVSPGGLA